MFSAPSNKVLTLSCCWSSLLRRVNTALVSLFLRIAIWISLFCRDSSLRHNCIHFHINKHTHKSGTSLLCFHITRGVSMSFKDGIKRLEVNQLDSGRLGCCAQRRRPARNVTKAQGFYINQAAKARSHRCHFLLRWLTLSKGSQKHIC